MSDPLFSRRVAIALGAVAAASFIGGLLFALLGAELREEASHENDTFSRSAIGHHALASLLRRLDVPVVVSRAASGRRAGAGTALLLLEPQVEAHDPTAQDLPEMIRESSAGAIVVVLPKWRTGFRIMPGGFVDEVEADPAQADAVLRAIEVYARLRPAEGGWQVDGWPAAPTLERSPQVLEGGAFEPLISDTSGGVLVGQVQTLGHEVTVISDPDLLNNAGIFQGKNAEITLALLERVVGDRTVMIDETLHGFAVPEGVWPQLFRFPLVLVVAQVVGVLVLLLWAGMRRFGAPAPVVAILGRGRRVLVENTARVLWFGGHSQDALARYWAETRKQVALTLHAPPRLESEGLNDPVAGSLNAWLDGVGQAKQAPETTGEIEAAVITAHGDAERMLVAARRVGRWRAGMLG
jgi:hypothetical protein